MHLVHVLTLYFVLFPNAFHRLFSHLGDNFFPTILIFIFMEPCFYSTRLNIMHLICIVPHKDPLSSFKLWKQTYYDMVKINFDISSKAVWKWIQQYKWQKKKKVIDPDLQNEHDFIIIICSLCFTGRCEQSMGNQWFLSCILWLGTAAFYKHRICSDQTLLMVSVVIYCIYITESAKSIVQFHPDFQFYFLFV